MDSVCRTRRDGRLVVNLARHTSEKHRRQECRIGRSDWLVRPTPLFAANSESIAIDDQQIKNCYRQQLREM